MRRFLQGVRAGLLFRWWSFVQFLAVVRRDPRQSLRFRSLVDYLWTAIVRGHVPDELLDVVYIELDSRSSSICERYADGPDWYIRERARSMVARLADGPFDGPDPFGYGRNFFLRMVLHLRHCQRCDERLVMTVRHSARVIRLVRRVTGGAAEEMDEEASDRVLRNVMAEIDRLERDQEAARPRLIESGSDDGE